MSICKTSYQLKIWWAVFVWIDIWHSRPPWEETPGKTSLWIGLIVGALSHGSQPCRTHWNFEPWHVGPLQMDRSWWRALIECSSLEKEWQTTLEFLPWEPYEQYEKAKRYNTERWTPQVLHRCPYATREEWRKWLQKEWGEEPKQKQCPLVDMTGDGSKVQCWKEQYCLRTWNVRSMNPGKLKWLNKRWQEWTLTF